MNIQKMVAIGKWRFFAGTSENGSTDIFFVTDRVISKYENSFL